MMSTSETAGLILRGDEASPSAACVGRRPRCGRVQWSEQHGAVRHPDEHAARHRPRRFERARLVGHCELVGSGLVRERRRWNRELFWSEQFVVEQRLDELERWCAGRGQRCGASAEQRNNPLRRFWRSAEVVHGGYRGLLRVVGGRGQPQVRMRARGDRRVRDWNVDRLRRQDGLPERPGLLRDARGQLRLHVRRVQEQVQQRPGSSRGSLLRSGRGGGRVHGDQQVLRGEPEPPRLLRLQGLKTGPRPRSRADRCIA